jgi:hypothetical protein
MIYRAVEGSTSVSVVPSDLPSSTDEGSAVASGVAVGWDDDECVEGAGVLTAVAVTAVAATIDASAGVDSSGSPHAASIATALSISRNFIQR